MTQSHVTIRLAAVLGFLAVAIGAFGAHAFPRLLTQLSSEENAYRMSILETGVRYHMYHALALLGMGILQQSRSGSLRWPIRFTTLGIVLFSGSLYALALSGQKSWGMIAPLGGVALLAGWTSLAVTAKRNGS